MKQILEFPLILASLVIATLNLSAASSSSPEEFDWEMAKGERLTVALNQHPYADAIIARLPEFQKLTGIRVDHSITPEENYFDKITTSLFARNGTPDVFMTGIYQMWDYAASGFLEPLDGYLRHPARTHADYEPDDFLPGVMAAGRWTLKPGSPVGMGPLWTVPLGFEQYVLAYNKKLFDERGIKVPTTLEELYDTAVALNGWNGPGSYGVAARGTRSWATIHPGYMTMFTTAGAKDFELNGGRLESDLDSPESIAVTKLWAELMRDAGPPAWSTYTWYQCGADLGAGKAAMSFDADIAAYFQNVEGSSNESGNIAFAPPPAWEDGGAIHSNQWVWALAMNASSEKKDAAWLFMQYFTGKEHMRWGALHAKVVDPARRSVWEHPDFKKRLSGHSGYFETFEAVVPHSRIQFTPQPLFFESTTLWAAALQKMVTSDQKPEEIMKDLANNISRRTKRLRTD